MLVGGQLIVDLMTRMGGCAISPRVPGGWEGHNQSSSKEGWEGNHYSSSKEVWEANLH